MCVGLCGDILYKVQVTLIRLVHCRNRFLALMVKIFTASAQAYVAANRIEKMFSFFFHNFLPSSSQIFGIQILKAVSGFLFTAASWKTIQTRYSNRAVSELQNNGSIATKEVVGCEKKCITQTRTIYTCNQMPIQSWVCCNYMFLNLPNASSCWSCGTGWITLYYNRQWSNAGDRPYI